MKIEILQNPLDKGETWEKKSIRQIEICQSTDNRGAKPNVYFGVFKHKNKKPKELKITEDLFLTTEMAINIGKALIAEAKKIDADWKQKQNK